MKRPAMRRRRNFSLEILILLLFTANQFTCLKGQSIQYSIQGDRIDDTPESISALREVKSVDNYSIEITYTFPGYSISDVPVEDEVYQILRIDGFGLSLNAGKPSLPIRTEKIALPSDAEPILTITSSEYLELDGVKIYPAQEMTADNTVGKLVFRKNLEAYTNDKFFPKKLATIENIQIYRDFPLAYIQIHPVQYNPFQKKVRIYKSLTVRVEYKPLISTVSTKSNAVSNYSILNNSVINPAAFKKHIDVAKAATTIDPIGYIIVTTPEFEAATDLLADWKRQLGYKVQILSQNSWSIAQVKSAVENVYNTMDPTPSYLVILGDQEDVPDYYYENIYLTPILPVHSTNYYACMDGSNDYIPEMAHGRISVNSANQAVQVIQKIINFEKNPPSDPTFYSKGLHAGYFEDSLRDGTSDKRYAHTTIEIYEYLQNQGYQSDLVLYTEPDVVPKHFNSYYSGNTTIPSQYLKENGFAWDGDKYDILNALNDGRIYAFHRDHGKPYRWVRPEFDLTDMDALANGNETPIVFSINCASGLFTRPEPEICFSEKLLRFENGGAVGIVAATEETRSGYNDGLIMGMIDAIWPDPGLIPDLGDGGETVTVSSPREPIYTMGDVMIQGLIRMTENWDPIGWADRDQFHLYHYFGDPAMQFWTAVPTAIWANHTSSINTSSTAIQISGSNCPGGLATVVAGNELLACVKLTDGSGTIQLSEALGSNNPEITLTISKHNYIPYIAKLTVTGAAVPELPNAASNLSAQLAGTNTIQLTWIDNADNETYFEMERSVNDGTFTAITTLPPNSQSYNDIINQSGVSYAYRIKAVNSDGSSDYAYSSSVFVPTGTAEHVAGYNEIYSTEVYNNYRRAQNVTMPEDGTITKISMYHGGGGGSLLYAVYSNSGGKPGDLLAVTPVTSLNSSEGWQEVNLETPVFVPANTTIWLGWVYQYSPALHYTSGGPGRAHSGDTWSNQMPSSFGSSSVSSYTYSIYATYTGYVSNPIPEAPSYFYHYYDEDMPMIHLGWKDNSTIEEGFILERKENSGSFETLVTLNENDTAYTDYAIEYNQIYEYRVMAFNANGNSDYSDVRSVNTTYITPSAPNAPTNLTGVFSGPDKEISLNWTDNSSNEDEFILERKVNSGNFEVLDILPSNTISYIDSLIQYYQTYSYRISAENSIGNSGYSNEIEINSDYTPASNPPAAPENIEAQLVNSNTIQITWSDLSDNEYGFKLDISLNSGSYSTIAWINANTTYYLDTIPLMDASYRYRLSAYNGDGFSAAITSESVYVPIPGTAEFGIVGYDDVFSTPVYNDYRRAQCVEMPENGTLLTISMYHGGGGGSVLYAIYDNIGGRPGNRLGVTEVASTNSSEGWQEIDLKTPVFVQQGTRIWLAWIYQYSPRLFYTTGGLGRAHSGDKWSAQMPMWFGSSSVSGYSYSIHAIYQSEGTPDPTSPNQPSSLTAVMDIAIPNVLLNWTDNANNEGGFIIERSINSGNFTTLTTVSANTTFFTDNTIGYNSIYGYRVKATNSIGDSPYSNIVSVNTEYTPPSPPAAPSSLAGSYNALIPAISLTWQDNSDNETTFIIDRKMNNGFFQTLTSLAANSISFTDNNISYGNTYEYKIFASNSVGLSNSSDSIHFTATLPEIPPAEPSSLTLAYSANVPAVHVSWIDNSGNEDGFVLEKSMNGSSYEFLSTLSANETEYYDYALDYLEDYAYRVYGFNAFGNSAFSNSASVFTSIPNSDPLLVGYTDILPMKVYSCYRRAQQVTIPTNGNIESITMYHGPGKGNLLYGVYADNGNAPGNLLATTPVTPNSLSLGWQTVNLTSPLTVVAGQKVWLAWVFTNGTDIYYGNGTPGRAHSNEFWTGSLPDPFGSASFGNYIYSIYLTLYPEGTPKSGESEHNKSVTDARLLVYPEPVTENIIFYSIQHISEADMYNLELLDMSGRVILRDRVWIEPGVEYEIGLESTLEKSLLILRIYNEKNTHIKKIALSN